jgi:4-hydroxythreonine-4-phosphate dehydrogenase
MKKVVITTGDPAGCGPIITLEAVGALSDKKIDFFIVGDKKIMEEIPVYKKIKKRINLIDLNTTGIKRIKKGEKSKLGGQTSLNYLNKGLEVLRQEKAKRLVTAPLSKEAVGFALSGFCGHTEYLAGYFRVKNFAMMMVSNKLKIVLFSRHIPLREVSAAITRRDFKDVIKLTYAALKEKFKIKNPKIAAVSVNPHAGINTFLDKEEKVIALAIKESGKKVGGPFPSDTIFIEENLKKFDCIICPYHDQAMIPFKMLSFKDGVNLTLGLPIIRTSPAHGVAYEVIREGKKPFSSSMIEAVKLAVKLNTEN